MTAIEAALLLLQLFFDDLHTVGFRIFEFFDLAVPIVKVNCGQSRSYPPWFSSEILNSIRCKTSLHLMLQNIVDSVTRFILNSLKLHASDQIVNYWSLPQQLSTHYWESKFWSFVNNNKGSSPIPGLMRANGIYIGSSRATVEAFAAFFKPSFWHPCKLFFNCRIMQIYICLKSTLHS